MSELRLNRATKEWIILAKERTKRPNEFPAEGHKEKLPAFDPTCPFCPGNENKTPPEVFALRDPQTKPNHPGWRIRVVTNRFPALNPAIKRRRRFKITGEFFKSAVGLGKHEVIIESPEHNRSLATLSLKQVQKVCEIYWKRYLALKDDKRFKLIIIFKNHGISAGTSLKHSHSQLIALPLVPTSIRHLLEEAMIYYGDHGSCVFCDMIHQELVQKKRIILNSKEFVVFHPFASRTPFETWIVPKKHNACFGDIDEKEVMAMASVLKEVLGNLYLKLKDPDYNLMIRTAPIKDAQEDYYHWYIQILPRLTTRRI